MLYNIIKVRETFINQQTDEMYEKAAMHNEDGAWQMIFGVNTLPDYRKHGYAGQLIQCAIKDAADFLIHCNAYK